MKYPYELLEDANIEDLKGISLKEVIISEGKDEVIFISEDLQKWVMNHRQECCERVDLEDVIGDIQDLTGTPILEAYVSTTAGEDTHQALYDYDESFTWTFYSLGTMKGRVTFRWYGSSNGCYSEAVYFNRCKHGARFD